jgi:hypothetical protein
MNMNPHPENKEKVLRISTKARRAALAGMATIGTVLALGSGSALAASWSPAGAQKQAGTLTLKMAGGSPSVCQIEINGNAGGNVFVQPGGFANGSCQGGTVFSVRSTVESAVSSGGSFFTDGTMGDGYSPYGYWVGSASYWLPWHVPFVNAGPGTGLTKSRMTFSNTLIGYVNSDISKPLTISGVLEVTTPTGGLVWIIP